MITGVCYPTEGEVAAEENVVSAEDVNNVVTDDNTDGGAAPVDVPVDGTSVENVQPEETQPEEQNNIMEDFSAIYGNQDPNREQVVSVAEEVPTEPVDNTTDMNNNYGNTYQEPVNNDYNMNQFNNNFEDDFDYEVPNTNFNNYDFNDNMNYDNFDSTGLQLPSRNMMNDVTATISNLVEINRNQQSMLDEYEIKLTKCNASRTKYAELSKQQAREIANLNARLGKAEAEIQMLQSKLASLGSATNGELARAIADAQNLIGNTRMRRRTNNMM